MKPSGKTLGFLLGLALGCLGTWLFHHTTRPALAANDRYQDYILCTGPVALNLPGIEPQRIGNNGVPGVGVPGVGMPGGVKPPAPVGILPGFLGGLNPAIQTDGIWLLDYRAGKLLGTVIDVLRGKIINWAEVDLVQEFQIAPGQNVHFMMTTGSITQGQAALYVAETTTGRFGVYTMGPRPDGLPGIAIRRHDLVMFRQPPPAQKN